jgi:hypothetical protein
MATLNMLLKNFPINTPKRLKNKDVRCREYLTEQEVELLMNAARKTGRHGHRDATLTLELDKNET